MTTMDAVLATDEIDRRPANPVVIVATDITQP
jgi:hypothetical protein